MYKVLVVDDEEVIREGFKYIIDWGSLGFEILATASDGAESLELIKELNIDLVLVDINMPNMMGLELISAVKEFNKHIKFIIISGYDDFKYAQKAINYNVIAYLLKPVDEEDLEESLRLAKKHLDDEEKNLNYHLISSLANANNNFASQDIPYICQIAEKYYFISLLEDEILENPDGTFPLSSNISTQSSILNVVKKVLGKENEYMIIGVEKNEISIVLLVGQMLKFDSPYTFIYELKRHLFDMHINDCSVLIGKAVSNINQISESKQSVDRLKNKMIYCDTNSILDYNVQNYDDSIDDSINNDITILSVQISENINTALRQNDIALLNKSINEFCDALNEKQVVGNSIKLCVHSIVIDAITMIESNEHAGYMLELLSRFYKVRYIRLEKLKKFLLYFFSIISDIIKEEKKKDSSSISDILHYMNINYNQNLSLQLIAKEFYINRAYLGRLFKAKTGKFFNTYLNEIRIIKAKELLEKTNLKVYEIAEKVGYSDINYFSKKFEELEKTTPSNYRNKFISNE